MTFWRISPRSSGPRIERQIAGRHVPDVFCDRLRSHGSVEPRNLVRYPPKTLRDFITDISTNTRAGKMGLARFA